MGQGLSDSRWQGLGQCRQTEGGRLEIEREGMMQNRNDRLRLQESVNSNGITRQVERLRDPEQE